jgi:uncharacterized membrane protein
MSLSHALSSPSTPAGRYWLFGSLALNLFLIGIASALLIREPEIPDRSINARIERLASTLPSPDADKLRADFRAQRQSVNDTRGGYDRARDAIRAVLRREPFDATAMRDAMAKARSARQEFDQVMHGIMIKAAGEMSAVGREKLAEWPPGRR